MAGCFQCHQSVQPVGHNHQKGIARDLWNSHFGLGSLATSTTDFVASQFSTCYFDIRHISKTSDIMRTWLAALKLEVCLEIHA